jgi:3'-5' exoribonuclease
VPCTREATLVHMIDNLGGRLGQLRPAGEGARARRGVVAFDRAIGGGAYFGPGTARALAA